MTSAIILRCRPETQFHFGRGGLDVEAALHDTSERPHSDTLFAALLFTAAQMAERDEVDALRELFASGQVCISSGFYCLEKTDAHKNNAGEEEQRFLYFLPCPEHYIIHETKEFKAINRLQFISTGIWESGITPAHPEWEKDTKVLQQKFMVTEKEADWLGDALESETKLFSIVTHPHVYARRSGEADTFYFLANVMLHALPKPWQTHYYFLLDADEETRKSASFQLLQTAVDLLSDTGIGGERSGGCGQLAGLPLWQDFQLDLPNSAGFVTASLTLPKDSADLAKFQYYKTFLRGGRPTATDQKLGFIRMIGEGAYLNAAAEGRLQLLKEGREVPYYRNGMAYCLPVHADTQPPER